MAIDQEMRIGNRMIGAAIGYVVPVFLLFVQAVPQHLMNSLEQLPPHQRVVLEARFFDQQSFAELAASLGKSEGALRVVCLRALRKLQSILGDEP